MRRLLTTSEKSAGSFRNAHWLALAPFAFAAFALAYWGFAVCSIAECKSVSEIERLERSLDLVRGRGSFRIGVAPWQLVIAQWLVPAVALFAAAKLFLIGLRRDLRTAFARRSRDHTVVCGLGDTGKAAVEILREAGERVVAIDLAGDTPNAQAADDLGAPTIAGDATADAVLRIAGVKRAKALLACTGDDGLNLEVALAATRLANGRAGRALVSMPEMRSGWLHESFAGHASAAMGSDAAVLRCLNLDEQAGRLLVRHPAFAALAERGRDPDLLVVGFGDMGREIVAQAIGTAFALPDARPRISLLDARGDVALDEFRLIHPGIDGVADLTAETARIMPNGAGGTAPLDAAIHERRPQAVIVCVPDDDEALFVALRARLALDAQGATASPVFVRVTGRRNLADVIARAAGDPDRLVPFGDRASLLRASLLGSREPDVLARAVHEAFRRSLSDGAEAAPSRQPWERLPETFKRSNRRFADHIDAKLRWAGLRSRATDTPASFEPSIAERDAMAEAEHARWLVERRMAGWTVGETRDDLRRRHPLLVAWSDLPRETQDSVRAVVNGIPAILGQAGQEITRVPP